MRFTIVAGAFRGPKFMASTILQSSVSREAEPSLLSDLAPPGSASLPPVKDNVPEPRPPVVAAAAR
jgi:hypothetical protein